MRYCKKYQSIKFERFNWVSLWSFPLVSSLGPPSDFLGSQYWPPSWSDFPEAPNTPPRPQLTSLKAHVTSPGPLGPPWGPMEPPWGPMGPSWGPMGPPWGPMGPPWGPISPRSLCHLPVASRGAWSQLTSIRFQMKEDFKWSLQSAQGPR